MRLKPGSAARLLCFLSFLYFGPSSSVELPAALTESRVQESQDGRNIASKSDRRIEKVLKFKTPKEYIRDMSSLTEGGYDFEDNESGNREPCNLNETLRKELKPPDGSIWIINASTLKTLDNDPQELIHCTERGDRVAFNLTGQHKFKRTLEIIHPLELFTGSSEGKAVGNDTLHTATFTCPDSGPFLIIKSDSFKASGFAVQNCTESSKEGAIVVLSQSKFALESSIFTSNQNRSIFVASNAGLELKNCHFENNGNQNNDGGAIHVLNNVSLSIRSSSFYGNNARYGGAVYGNNGVALTILFSNLSSNYAQDEGGAIFINDNINLSLIDTTLLGNNAGSYGGAISGYDTNNVTMISANVIGNNAMYGGAIVLDANNNVKTISTNVTANNARWSGGAILLYGNNNVNIINTNVTKNNAGDSGGAILLYDNNNVNINNTNVTKNNAGDSGGAISLVNNNNLFIINTNLKGNNAQDNGGAISLNNRNILNVSNTVFSKNRAKYDGGAISLNNRNHLSLLHTTLSENCGSKSGGAIFSKDANALELFYTSLSRNNASQHGGALRLYDSNQLTLLNTTLSRNNAMKDGGGMRLSEKNNMTMVNSTICENKAEEAGGALIVGSSCSIGITTSTILGNSANLGGAIFSGAMSVFSINQTKFEKNKATFGGCFYGESMSLHVQDCACQENSALTNGGCFHLGSSNATCKESKVLSNHVENSGGGIYAFDESLLRMWNSSLISNSANRGGGIALLRNSRILCVNCSFENNSAIQGGGLYIISNASQFLLAQLTISIFRGNKASCYGGGMIVKTFGIRAYDCKNLSTPCDRIVLDEPTFINNRATFFGSSIVITKPDNVLVDCEARHAWTHGLMNKSMILKRLSHGTLKAIDPEKPCKSWKDGGHFNETCKVGIGTFAHKFNLTTNSTQGLQIDGNHSIGFIFKNVQSGKPSPNIRVTTLDAFGNPYAPFLMEGITMKLNSSEGLRGQKVRCSFKNGTCTIVDLIYFVLRINYTIYICPQKKDIFKATTITIIVRGCIVDEESALDGKVCRECGDASYNFNLSSSVECQPCPESANCTTRYIKPNHGYWHRSPCHSRVKTCIVEEACEDKDRIEKLTNLTRDLEDCNLNDTMLTNYRKAQCREGYEGPLCGSCEKSYERLASLQCVKCGPIRYLVLRILFILVWLLVTTIITIRGTLPIASRCLTRTVAVTPLLEDVNPIQFEEGTSTQAEEMPQEGSNAPQVTTNDEQQVSSNVLPQLAHDVKMAAGTLMETWKTLLNFLQVISSASIMDLKWTNRILTFFKTLNVLGSATLNAISGPIDCVVASYSVKARIILMCVITMFVPILVIAILSIFWYYRFLVKYRAERHYFLRRFLLTTITVIYITYFDITQVAVRALNCVDIYDETDSFFGSSRKYWAANTLIECYKGTHVYLVGTAIVSMTVSIGFPLVCARALLKNRNKVNVSNSRVHEILGLLCGPFKDQFVYWECIIIIKKASLAVIMVFSSTLSGQEQGLLISIVIVFFLALHSICFPFKKEFNILNYYEIGSLMTSGITYILVQFLNDKTSETAKILVFAALVILIGGFIILMALNIARSLIAVAKVSLRSYGIIGMHDEISWFETIKLYLVS